MSGDASQLRFSSWKRFLSIVIFIVSIAVFNRLNSPTVAERQLDVMRAQHQKEMQAIGPGGANTTLGFMLEDQWQATESRMQRDIAWNRFAASGWLQGLFIAACLVFAETYWFRMYRSRGCGPKDAFFNALIHAFRGASPQEAVAYKEQVTDDMHTVGSSVEMKKILIVIAIASVSFMAFMLAKVIFQF